MPNMQFLMPLCSYIVQNFFSKFQHMSHTTIGIIRPKRGVGTQCYTFRAHEYINERTVEEGFR